jgi:hypothetical protein
MRPIPMTKLMIFATNVSNPANTNAAPKNVDPIYPADKMITGIPPSTIVAPPTNGSIETRRIDPPVKMA